MSEQKVTFCRICEAACGLVAQIEDGQVKALEPDPKHLVSRGYACIKGTRYHLVHGSPDRVKQPLKRVGERFEPISWEQALAEIGEKARAIREKHGKHGLGMYMGNPAAFNLTHPVFAAGFRQALGTRHLYTAGSQDCSNKFRASQEMFGSPVIQPIPDFDRVRCFVIIGSNPAISQMSFVHAPRPIERLKAIEKAGGKVYFVNPRKTESASQVGEQVFIRPDTDAYFLLSFAHEVFQRGALDRSALEHLRHVDELREAVSDFPAERTAEVTGITPERLRELVTRYLAADGAALYGSTGLNQGRHGTIAIWLVHAINAITGNLDRRGGSLVPPGLVKHLALLGRLTGTGMSRHRSRMGDHAAVMDALPGAVMASEILTPGAGQLRGLFVTAGNPVLSMPNGAHLDKALASLDLLVCIDLFRNETARHAHYVLPGLSFLERPDIPLSVQGLQPIPYLQYTEAVVAPDGEQRDEWWILTLLADAIGVPMFGSRPAQAYLTASAKGRLPRAAAFDVDKIYASMALAGGSTLHELRKKPHGKLLRDHQPGTFLGRRLRVLTRDGKVDVAPDEIVRGLADLESDFEQDRHSGPQLKLITKRERNSHNSWMHNVEPFVRPPKHTNYLYMHPDDARARALDDGDLAEVSTATGRVSVPVKHSPDLMPGVVALPHGWGHREASGLSVASKTEGVNANLIAADGPARVERLGGMSHLTGIPVEVRRVEPEELPASAE